MNTQTELVKNGLYNLNSLLNMQIYVKANILIHHLPRVFNRHLPWENFSDEELLRRFRFGHESMLFIARLIEDEVRPLTRRNYAISTEQQLLIALRFFASGSFLQVIGDTHGYEKATVSRIVRKVSLALASKHEELIKFPTTIDQLRNLVAAPSRNMETRLIMQNESFIDFLARKLK